MCPLSMQAEDDITCNSGQVPEFVGLGASLLEDLTVLSGQGLPLFIKWERPFS